MDKQRLYSNHNNKYVDYKKQHLLVFIDSNSLKLFTQHLCDIFSTKGMRICCKEENELYCSKINNYLTNFDGIGNHEVMPLRDLCSLSPYIVRYAFPAFDVIIDYNNPVFFNTAKQGR